MLVTDAIVDAYDRGQRPEGRSRIGSAQAADGIGTSCCQKEYNANCLDLDGF
jgi:hypothetical protein